MRDKSARLWLASVTVATVLAVVGARAAPAQAREDEAARLLGPAARLADAEPFPVLLRHFTSGAGADRAAIRQKWAARVGEFHEALIAEVGSTNHSTATSAALVLGETRERRAFDMLVRCLAGEFRGAEVAAPLALGKLDDVRGVAPLINARGSRVRAVRHAAALALGRLGGDAATSELIRSVGPARQDADQVPILIGLALTGDPRAAREIMPFTRAAGDLVRRTATAALARLDDDIRSALLVTVDKTRAEILAGVDNDIRAALVARLDDNDVIVRQIALHGLATCADAETATKVGTRVTLARSPDERLRAGAALVLAARAGPDGHDGLKAACEDAQAKVRAAAIFGCRAVGGPGDDQLLQRALGDGSPAHPGDVSGDVRRVAVITAALRARAQPASFARYFNDPDAGVRDAALVADVWLLGADAQVDLEYIAKARKDDKAVVARVEELLKDLAAPAGFVKRIATARLQAILDDTGAAPSWAVLVDLNLSVIIALGLESALGEAGSGTPPAGGGTSAERAAGAAARRPAPETEDLRRHLDRHPYADRRATLDIPGLR